MKTNKPTQSLEKQILEILQRWYLSNPELNMNINFMYGVTTSQQAELLSLFSQEHKRLSNLIKEEVDKTIPYIETLTKSKNEAYDNGYRDGLKTALNKLEREL